MKFKSAKHFLAAAFCGVMATGGLTAQAASWPDKSVEVIVPYTPGGATDTVTRAITQRLSERLGQTFIVTNKPGANGTIASAIAARAKPDGYTFITVLAAHTVNPHLYTLPYTLSDFEPVSYVAELPLFLFVANNVPANNLQELVKYGQDNPDTLMYGSSGAGSSAHLTSVNFGYLAGMEMTHVPYKGSAPILTDLLAGRVSMVFDPILVPMQYAKRGELKVLAVTSADRWEDEPEIPTVAESGFPGFAMSSWAGILAPAGTPQDIIDKLAAEIAEIAKEPAVIQRFKDAGFVLIGDGPAVFQERINSDTEMYAEIIKKANISLN